VGSVQWNDDDDEYNHIVVRNWHMTQQSGERWDEMEDMDEDVDDEGAGGEENDREADVLEGQGESAMPQDRQTIVINLSLLCFSYLEEYHTQ